MRRTLGLLFVMCSACLEAPPGSTVLDASPSADAFVCTGDCCGAPVTALTDDFEDGVPGPWEVRSTDPACVVSEVGGALYLSNLQENAGCFYLATGLLIAGGETASIELVDAGDGRPNAEFRLELSSMEKVSFERADDGLQVTNRPPGAGSHVVKAPVSFVPEAYHFLRFRGGQPGATVLLETSSDGRDWSPFYTHELLEPGTDACVQIEIATYGPPGDGAEDQIAFDNFNLIP